jgi:hypothetical protein
MKKTILFLNAVLVALLLSINANALTIVGDSDLISSSDTIIQDWLGEGPITLTSIYSSNPGDTAENFHAAVDGKGRTISLIKVAETGEIIGGYNPASWSTAGWIMATSPYEAFIFNLTNREVRYQSNDYKTYDSIDFGPTFGGGYDFKAVPGAQGFSYAYSYLAEVPNGPAVYPMGYPGIVGGDGMFTSEKIEVFTITLGESSASEAKCWDLNKNGVKDRCIEDIDRNGVVDENDCVVLKARLLYLKNVHKKIVSKVKSLKKHVKKYKDKHVKKSKSKHIKKYKDEHVKKSKYKHEKKYAKKYAKKYDK